MARRDAFRGAEGGVSSAPVPTRAAVKNVRSFCSLGIGETTDRDDSVHAPQILGVATCTRRRHRRCIRCHWCFRKHGAADRMGGRCRDCRAVVCRAGLAMAAVAGAGPGGDTRRRGASILAVGGWSNCCLGHAAAENWTALRRRTRGQVAEINSGLVRIVQRNLWSSSSQHRGAAIARKTRANWSRAITDRHSTPHGLRYTDPA
jgi:hypothetical protein